MINPRLKVDELSLIKITLLVTVLYQVTGTTLLTTKTPDIVPVHSSNCHRSVQKSLWLPLRSYFLAKRLKFDFKLTQLKITVLKGVIEKQFK